MGWFTSAVKAVKYQSCQSRQSGTNIPNERAGGLMGASPPSLGGVLVAADFRPDAANRTGTVSPPLKPVEPVKPVDPVKPVNGERAEHRFNLIESRR